MRQQWERASAEMQAEVSGYKKLVEVCMLHCNSSQASFLFNHGIRVHTNTSISSMGSCIPKCLTAATSMIPTAQSSSATHVHTGRSTVHFCVTALPIEFMYAYARVCSHPQRTLVLV